MSDQKHCGADVSCDGIANPECACGYQYTGTVIDIEVDPPTYCHYLDDQPCNTPFLWTD